MNPRLLALPALAALAALVALAVTGLAPVIADGPPPATPQPPAEAPRRVAPADRVAPPPQAHRDRYRLTYRVTTTLDGRPGPAGRVEGTWSLRPLRDGRVRARLIPTAVDGHHTLPPAEAMTAAIELVGAPGEPLTGIGFPAGTPLEARRLHTQLAAAFWYVDGPGDRWQADEEDAAGAYVAEYQRTGDGVVRTVVAYTALRGPDGLSTRHAAAATPAGQTRFVFDADGLREVEIATRLTFDMGRGAPRIETAVEGRLERIDRTPVALADGALRVRPIEGHVDLGDQRAVVDDARVAGADLPALLAEVERVGRLDPADRETRAWRSVTLRRLSALLRLDPMSAPALADAARAADDPRRAGLLLGALGSAGTPSATEALAGLLDDALDPGFRRAVTHQLALADGASPAVIDALIPAAAGGDPAAMAALGAQSGRLGEGDPAAAAAIETLLARYGAAESGDDKRRALMALGNSGAPRAMDVLLGNLAVRDPGVADAAVFGLRFMPPGEADTVLAAVLDRGDRRALAAVRAAAFRDPALWRDRLTAAAERFGDDARMARAIESALARLD